MAGSSTIRRSSLPTGVSPGSKVSSDVRSRAARAQLRSGRDLGGLARPFAALEADEDAGGGVHAPPFRWSSLLGPSVVEASYTVGRTDVRRRLATVVRHERHHLDAHVRHVRQGDPRRLGGADASLSRDRPLRRLELGASPSCVSAAAVACWPSLVGRSVEQLGDRFGPGATGVLQSALGNLPELFICIFALKAGLVDVVRAALVGSILANLLLVLGLAFVVGGLKHGTQQLGSERARTIVVLMLLSVTAMAIPSLTHWLHTAGRRRTRTPFSVIVSVLLLVLFALSLPFSLRRDSRRPRPHAARRRSRRVAGRAGRRPARGRRRRARRSSPTGSWTPSQPAMDALSISQAFAGLVVVAIAGNAIENVVGVQLAAKDQSEYAFSVDPQQPAPDRAGARARAGARLARSSGSPR